MLELCNSRRCFLEMDEEQIREAAKNLDFGKILDYMKRVILCLNNNFELDLNDTLH